MNMALLRRWIPGILRSGRQLAANRMITTTGGGISWPESPWLMMEPVPAAGKCGSWFRFWCCEKEVEHRFKNNIRKSERRRLGLKFMESDNLEVAKLVGSSQGRLAYNYKRRIYLIDPTTFRCIKLPKLVGFLQRNVRRVVLDDERELGKAFMICGVGSLAFCSSDKNEWSVFSERDVEYESVVYSRIDQRLLCLTYMMKLEAWDVGGESPRLDWTVQIDNPPVHYSLDWVRKVRYLAYADQTGDLFLVLRYFKFVNPERITRPPHVSYEDPTVYFEVYKIKVEMIDGQYTTRLIKMEQSLEGMTIFVGMNDGIAIKIKNKGSDYDKTTAAIRRDSVYFTYDERIGNNKYIGIFDYGMRIPYPLFSPNLPDEYLQHDYDGVDYPLWFAPRHTATV